MTQPESTMIGLYDEETKTLKLLINPKKVKKIKTISILWLLLHEFRHHIQFQDKNILSVVKNKNTKKFWKFFDNKNKLDLAEHTLHELNPLEIDANMFASEILEIPYPNNKSKFSLTNKRLKKLFK